MRSISFVSSSVAVALAFAFACGDTTDDPSSMHGPSGGSDASSTGDGGSVADATPEPPAQGVRADYYDQFRDLRFTRFEDVPGFATREASPGDGLDDTFYSIRWTGTFELPAATDLRFKANSDDGVRVYVDDTAVIDDWSQHAARDAEGKSTLTAGTHTLRVEYFQWTGPATFSLAWARGDEAFAPIAKESLKPLLHAPKDQSGAELGGAVPAFTNPVVPFDCPDPGVINAPDPRPAFYMVCTGGSFPIRKSRNLVGWQDTGVSVLPSGKASWSANGGRNWAPELHKVGSNFLAYFTAVNGNDVLSIGVASATSMLGPFTTTSGPLVENPVGIIDPNFFEDDNGIRYVLQKVDGNSVGRATPITIRQMNADGLSYADGTGFVELIRNSLGWENGIVEAPWLIKRNGKYYLFYSGNNYNYRYRTGVARADNILGPYEKKGDPILVNNDAWVGPGHGSVVTAHGTDYFFFHAWPALPNGTEDRSRGRLGHLAMITWGADGWPTIGTGSTPTFEMTVP